MDKKKDLNTYEDNICYDRTFKGLSIIVSCSAMHELIKEAKTLTYVIKILEDGYEPRKRKIGTIEKWLDKGNKTFNVVITKSYNQITKSEVWVLVHFGKFTRKKCNV